MVPTELVEQEWPRAEPFIARACARDETQDPISVFGEILTGSQALWVGWDEDGVKTYGTTKIYDTALKRICVINLAAGDNVSDHFEYCCNVFANYAKDMECEILEIQGRAGWKVLEPIGFKKVAVLYRKDL